MKFEILAEDLMILIINCNFQEIAEEHDALMQEKGQNEEDIVKLESRLQEVIERFEADANNKYEDFSAKYNNLPPEAEEVCKDR